MFCLPRESFEFRPYYNVYIIRGVLNKKEKTNTDMLGGIGNFLQSLKLQICCSPVTCKSHTTHPHLVLNIDLQHFLPGL